MLFRHVGEIGFLFSDMVLSHKQYAHDMLEHIIRAVLAAAVLVDATQYRTALKVFLLIELMEIVDYILTYGEPWFDSKIFTWNTIKVGLMGMAIVYEKYGK